MDAEAQTYEQLDKVTTTLSEYFGGLTGSTG